MYIYVFWKCFENSDGQGEIESLKWLLKIMPQ